MRMTYVSARTVPLEVRQGHLKTTFDHAPPCYLDQLVDELLRSIPSLYLILFLPSSHYGTMSRIGIEQWFSGTMHPSMCYG